MDRVMNAKTTFIGLAITAIVAGCSISGESGISSLANFDSAYLLADTARQRASSLGVEWRDTAMLLTDAKTANASGDGKTAMRLVKEAKLQSDLAIGQAEENKIFLAKVPYYNPEATPEEDLKNTQGFFRWRFPNLTDEDFSNGFYALDEKLRENWLAIEEFPPYFPAIDEGETLWGTPFNNGNYYGNCFGYAGVADKYPRWDKETGQVITLEVAINDCRVKNGEQPFDYAKSSELMAIAAYMAYKSRGKKINVVIPKDDPGALKAYNEGKKFYYSRRGQLNMACYQCHFDTAGQWLRTNMLGTAFGQTSHFPVYRSKWGNLGGLQRRYKGCNKQVRAKPFDLQSETYRNLEFFHTYMSNGIVMNGPGARF
jgi:sulfur-oxidizing protein SoxA